MHAQTPRPQRDATLMIKAQHRNSYEIRASHSFWREEVSVHKDTPTQNCATAGRDKTGAEGSHIDDCGSAQLP